MIIPLIQLPTLKHYIILYYLFFFFLFFVGLISNFYLYHRTKKSFMTFIICLLAIMIGGRSSNIGTDTLNYAYIFEDASNVSLHEISLLQEPIFVVFTQIISLLGNFHFYLFVISLITLFFTYRYCILLNEYRHAASPILLFFCIAISQVFFNQQINIIRSGLAMPFLLLFSYNLYLKNKKALVYACFAFGIHQTMIIPILIFCFIRCIKLSWIWYCILYVGSSILSYLAIGVHRLAFLIGLDSNKVDLYFSSGNFDYKVGFRWDFLLFNTLFLFVFLVLKQKDELLSYYVKYYILSSCLFFLWFYVPFSDRIGAFSWNFIPIILYLSFCNYFSSKQRLYGSFAFLFLSVVNIFLTGVFEM